MVFGVQHLSQLLGRGCINFWSEHMAHVGQMRQVFADYGPSLVTNVCSHSLCCSAWWYRVFYILHLLYVHNGLHYLLSACLTFDFAAELSGLVKGIHTELGKWFGSFTVRWTYWVASQIHIAKITVISTCFWVRCSFRWIIWCKIDIAMLLCSSQAWLVVAWLAYHFEIIS